MLKIVAGKYRSRQIEVPESVTVPTKNRVREAMLSSLGNQIQGANVLDLFAGSGALGIETLSRGSAHCDFVEVDSKAAQVLAENLKKLKEMNGTIHCCDFSSAISSFSTPFDRFPRRRKTIAEPRLVPANGINNVINSPILLLSDRFTVHNSVFLCYN